MRNLEDRTFNIDTSSRAKRILFSVVVLVLTVPLIYCCYRVFRADRIVRADKTFDGFTRALEYDPLNGTLWWQRGRVSQYSLQSTNIPQAIRDYNTALSLNPRISQAWVDLSDCYEQLDQHDEAEQALENARVTRPYSPVIRWQTGNYYLRRGDLPKMYENFRLAIEYDPEKLGIAMDLAWKADPDPARIFHELIPDALEPNLRYLDFLVSKDELDLARMTWERCLLNTIPPDFEFEVSAVFRYIDGLLEKARVPDALQVWAEALQKAGTDMRDSRLTGIHTKTGRTNLIWNGSFEDDLLQGGFDWRFTETKDYRFQIDLDNCRVGTRCLHLTFDNSNSSFAHLSQIVPIPEPGSYTLEFSIRSERLTADQMPYFTIQEFPEARDTTQRTPSVLPSTTWQEETVPFSVGPNCHAVLITLRRNPSPNINDHLKGLLWLDGIAIYRSSGALSKEE